MVGNRILGVLPLLLLLTLPVLGVEVGTVTMPLDGTLSVAIYTPNGQMVRTLLEASPQARGAVVSLTWDGKDDAGKPAPAGQYQWKSIASQAKGVDDGWIGDMGNPPYGELNEHGTDVVAVAVDAQDNVYECSGWEEAHEELRIWSPEGKGLAYRSAVGGRGIAVDADFIYQINAPDFKTEHAVVQRYSRDKIRLRNWMGTLHGPLELDGGVTALAASPTALWVCGADRVELHEKTTGALLRSFPVPAPTAVALDARGNGWVANHGDRVTAYTADGKKGREITGLRNPAALSIGGPARHLYIAEQATGRVLEYDLATLRRVRALFTAAQPGPVRDTALLWPLAGAAAVAVDTKGRITVADEGNHRVLTFAPDVTLLHTRFSEMVTAPMVDVTVNPNAVLSTGFEYEVDYSPGATHGQWKLANNWYGCRSGVRRKIGDRQYLFDIANSKHVVVYDLTGNTMRACAIVNAEKNLYTWADLNGDGKEQPAEQVTADGAGNYATLAPGVWVDGHGNFWIANWGGETVQVPLDSIDATGNPHYDWAHRKTIIAKDTSKWAMSPTNLRVDPATGDIYRLGSSGYYTVPNQWFWMGGAVVERYNAAGVRISAFPILGGKPTVVIATDSDGNYFYTGHSDNDQHWIRMYTSDGLLVTICRMGGPSGNSGGWMDHGLALTAFTHPTTGVHYAYAEEVYWGKAIRYRIDHLDTLVRPGQGSFTWNTAN